MDRPTRCSIVPHPRRPGLVSRGRIALIARKVGGVEEYRVLRLASARIEMPPKCNLIGATGAVLYPKLGYGTHHDGNDLLESI